MELIEDHTLSYIILTSSKGRLPERESVKLRRRATIAGIDSLTSIDTANALLKCLECKYSEDNTILVDINTLKL